jgi:hypothetical protein
MYNFEKNVDNELKYEETVCDCGCPSEIEDDFYENESEYESDNEEEIWALRRKMTGLKNITKEKIAEVREGYFKLSGKGTSTHLKVELGMDVIKYIWKMVIRKFTNKEHFDDLCEEIFDFIEKRLNKIEPYMRVEYENFKEDILELTSIEN